MSGLPCAICYSENRGQEKARTQNKLISPECGDRLRLIYHQSNWYTPVVLFVSLTLSAQQTDFFHAVEYRDEPAGRVRISGPQIFTLRAPRPQYTRRAREAQVVGVVVLEGTLGVDGCVRDVQLVRTLGYGLDESAMEAVQRWKFEPFLVNGVPSKTRIQGEIHFDPAWARESSIQNERKCGSK